MRLIDAISRQAAITEFSCCELTPDGGIDANYAIDFLERLPSAQPQDIAQDIARIIENEKDMRVIVKNAQPEIIRCKDCKWYGRADKRRFYRGMDCLQKRIDTIVPDKDFCSRAERRTDE